MNNLNLDDEYFKIGQDKFYIWMENILILGVINFKFGQGKTSYSLLNEDLRNNKGLLFFLDTGLLASLAKLSCSDLLSNRDKIQLLLKNLVSSEILKQQSMLN